MAYLPGLLWIESHGRFCGAGDTESSSENSYAKCIRIRLSKSARVKATLEGKDMFMGTIPVSFEQIDGQWQGVTQVGSCTSPVMIWLLNIEWSNGQRQQLALSVARE